ncbi:MAG: hypothetical protein NAG76_12880 [Candidatus Pristimantibacillus lignocellulolyticus]|uniref:Lipoprotein n=1 Tax=Candidatus Pristimantibacillus lignocellulolyticus TaxID=2994561 RepID=A0A9J6Z9W4_9BACL|nr:MAG: hypothetical protein NAG76_12880 [Candidatus Pristimantibacillus lignocellulolyticus]
MKWKNKAKKTATTTSAILLAIMLTACSDQNNNTLPQNNTQEEQTDVGSVPSTNLPEGTGELDPGSISGEGNSNGDNDTEKPNDNNSGSNNGQTAPDKITESDVISAKGIYIGAADNHTIEIEMDNTYISLQVDEDLQYIIDEFPSDKPVTFEYVEKTSKELGVTQNWLKSIKLE